MTQTERSEIDNHAGSAGIREAVAIFKDEKSLEEAVTELEMTAFARHDISVLGGKNDVERKFGEEAVSPTKVEDNPEAPRAAPIMAEERTLGGSALVCVTAYIGGCIGAVAANSTPEATLLVAIAAGSLLGGAIGGTAALLFRNLFKKHLEKQLEKGGLVLWVHTSGPATERMARAILKKHGGRHIHIHDMH